MIYKSLTLSIPRKIINGLDLLNNEFNPIEITQTCQQTKQIILQIGLKKSTLAAEKEENGKIYC